MGIREAKAAAAIYVRRSHRDADGSDDDDRRGGRSLAQQEQECRSEAKHKNLKVVEVFKEAEGTSASRYSSQSRPEYERALRDLDTGDRFRTLIIWDLDRLERRGWIALGELYERHTESGDRRILDTNGLDTSDPNQRLTIMLKAEIAADESRKLSKRVQRGKRGQKEDGFWLGGVPPYGIRAEGQKVAPDPATRKTARLMVDMALDGVTFRAIARELNAREIPSPRGALWRPATVRGILLSPAFAGLQSEGREPFINADGQEVSIGKGIITSAERRRILGLAAERTVPVSETAPDITRGARLNTALIGRLGYCSECGGGLQMTGMKGLQYYQCRDRAMNAGLCNTGGSIRVPILDDAVSDMFVDHLLDPRAPGGSLYALADHLLTGNTAKEQAQREDAEAEVRAAEEALVRLEDGFVDGLLDAASVKRQKPRLAKRLESAKAKLDKIAPAEPNYDDVDPDDLVKRWVKADLPARQKMLAATVKEIRLKPGKRGSRAGARGRVSIRWIEGGQVSY